MSETIGQSPGSSDVDALYGEPLRCLALNVLKSLGVPAADRDDIFQDVLLRVLKWLESGAYDSRKGTLEAFVLTVLRHRVIDYRRDEWRRQRRATARSVVISTEFRPDPSIAIHQAIQLLPPPQREIIDLSLAGMTTREIADCLGRSCGRTGALLASAKHMLKELLRDSAHGVVKTTSALSFGGS